jgi:hypothetical protein
MMDADTNAAREPPHTRYLIGRVARLYADVYLPRDIIWTIVGFADDFVEHTLDKVHMQSPRFKHEDKLVVTIVPERWEDRPRYHVILDTYPGWVGGREHSRLIKLSDAIKAFEGQHNGIERLLRRIYKKFRPDETDTGLAKAVHHIAQQIAAAYDASAESIVKDELMADTIRSE